MKPVPKLEAVARRLPPAVREAAIRYDFGMDLTAAMTGGQADRARERTRACSCTHPCHLSDSLAYDADFLVRFLDS